MFSTSKEIEAEAKARLSNMSNDQKLQFSKDIGLWGHIPNKNSIVTSDIGAWVLQVAMEAVVAKEVLDNLHKVIKIVPQIVDDSSAPKKRGRKPKVDSPASDFGFGEDNDTDDLVGDLVASVQKEEEENDPFDNLFADTRIRPVEGLMASSGVATPIGAMTSLDIGSKGEKIEPEIFNATPTQGFANAQERTETDSTIDTSSTTDTFSSSDTSSTTTD